MGAAPKPIRKLRKGSTALCEVLRERISNHEISPGVKLREQAVADEFKVSRARVRDALTILEQQGLVVRIPSRGAVVRQLDLDVTIQILDMREVLEGLAARLATNKAEPEYWDDLIATFEASVATPDKPTSAYIRNYELFRHRILIAAASPMLTSTVSSLYDQTKVVMRRLLLVSDRSGKARMEHIEVLKAMRNKEAALAERLRRKAIASARQYLEQYRDLLF
jgi:DNA-binding GntR family transcriptional regulator